MSTSNIPCAVCKVKFGNADSIYSTSCGHVFHFHCLNEWKCRTTSCPLCRSYNPQSFRIYLNFDEAANNNVENKLKVNEEQIKKLRAEIEKKDKKIDSVKRLYNISEQWRADLQDEMQKLLLKYKAENEKLSKTLSLKVDEIEHLKRSTESDKTSDGKNLQDFIFENSYLKEKLLTCEFENNDLSQNIKMLELKLKLLTEELRQHIKENIDLNIPKTKAEPSPFKCVDTIKAMVPNNNKAIGHHESGHKKRRNKIENINKTTSVHNIDLINCKSEAYNDRKIFIENFPEKDLVKSLSLKRNVVILAAKMFLILSESDIHHVEVTRHKHGPFFSYMNLTVTFKSIEKKKQFLSNKKTLNFHPSTMSIRIKEYIPNDAYAVFKYANKNLRPKGFNFIYSKDDQIFAKKNQYDTTSVLIKNISDVDKLLAEHI